MATIISNGSYKGIDEVDVKERRVVVRADLNVPLAGTTVSDATRIERLVPTLEKLSGRNAKVIVVSHLGRPDGKPQSKYSLRPVAEKLGEMMDGKTVRFVEDLIGPTAQHAVDAMKPGEIVVLENLRFYPGEESNDPGFVAQLSSLGDIFVNDAFSAAHRAHASIYGIAHSLPAFAGRRCSPSSRRSSWRWNCRQRPVVAIVGGAKVSTKMTFWPISSARSMP